MGRHFQTISLNEWMARATCVHFNNVYLWCHGISAHIKHYLFRFGKCWCIVWRRCSNLNKVKTNRLDIVVVSQILGHVTQICASHNMRALYHIWIIKREKPNIPKRFSLTLSLMLASNIFLFRRWKRIKRYLVPNLIQHASHSHIKTQSEKL